MKTEIAKSKKQPVDPMIGRYFHSLNAGGKIEWQGYVLGSPSPGLYLVQLFEWGWGEPNVQRLVPLEKMSQWLFYADREAMIYSYDYGAAREGGPYRERIRPLSLPLLSSGIDPHHV